MLLRHSLCTQVKKGVLDLSRRLGTALASIGVIRLHKDLYAVRYLAGNDQPAPFHKDIIVFESIVGIRELAVELAEETELEI